MVNIATGIVEANQFADYMKVLDKLAIALKGHAEPLDRQHQVKFTNALEELAEKVDEALDARRIRIRESRRPDAIRVASGLTGFSGTLEDQTIRLLAQTKSCRQRSGQSIWPQIVGPPVCTSEIKRPRAARFGTRDDG